MLHKSLLVQPPNVPAVRHVSHPSARAPLMSRYILQTETCLEIDTQIKSGGWRMEESPCVYLRDELQVVDVVLLGDDQLVDVALPLPLHGAQHVQQMQVSAP